LSEDTTSMHVLHGSDAIILGDPERRPILSFVASL